MTQGMIEAKALRQGCLQCRVDLGTGLRIVQVRKRTQSCQSNARCAMAPGEPEARIILGCGQTWRVMVSQVRPIFLFSIEEAPLPLDQFECSPPEAVFAGD